MAIIGNFTRTADGYCGTLQTLTLDLKVELRPSRKDHEKAPDFRFHGPFGEFGAAWQRVSASEREYLSCKLDDPTFPAAVYASMTLSDDGETYVLIWTR